MNSTLPDSFFNDLVAEIDSADTIGIALTGSHARGTATPHSDVDLNRLVAAQAVDRYEHYVLCYRQDRLVAISTGTPDDYWKALATPQEAIWAVPGLRQWRILLDKDGMLARLKVAADNFDWTPLRAAAEAYASGEVAGCAEEAHKILGALTRRDESAILYATAGLIFGLSRAVLVRFGVLIETENAYFRLAQETAGIDSAWTRCFRLAAGFDPVPADRNQAEARGIAALRLYQETVKWLGDVLRAEHLEVIERTVEKIGAALG